MEYDPYNAEDKQQRMRAIIITSVIALLVLGIAIWAIIAIVSGRGNTAISDATTTVSVEDSSSKKGTQDQTNNYPYENTNVPNTEGVTTQVEPAVETPAPAAEISTTGPEDILPLALVAGSAVMFAGSRSLAKREA